MKKKLLQTGIGLLFLLPLYTHAEEATSTQIVSTSTVGESTSDGEATSSPLSPPKNFTLCSQDAIEARDTSIASSRTVYNIAMTNALKDRKNKEKTSVAIVDESDKKNAIKISVTSYKNTVKNAQNALTQARKVSWQTFEDDIKKCHTTEDREIASQKEAKDASDSNNSTLTKKAEVPETKTIQETIKEQLSAFRSLFN